MRVLRSLTLGAVLALAAPAGAQTGETAAVITEIKPAKGRVEVKPAAGGDWRPARPLLALRVGDVVRTTEDASAVVLLSGGRGSVRVAGAAGTLTVPGAARGSCTTRGGWWSPRSTPTATSRRSTCYWAISTPAPASPTSPPSPSTKPSSC